MKKIYLKDIAENLNVSKTAVSLVLNNKGDENKISPDTQQRILSYAKKHNYVPNQLARGLSRGKSETIGLIVPNISDTFYAHVAGCVERKAKELGYTVIFSSSHEDADKERELIHSMVNRQVEGLIIGSTQKNQKEIQSLKSTEFPFVLIDRHYPDFDTDSVIIDNFEGARTATEHLIKLGRKRIGFITLKPKLEAMRQRLLGYEHAVASTGLEKFVKELDPHKYKTEMETALKDLWKFPNSVDAIVFSTHYLTALGLRELKRLGVKIPREVAIVSFDQLDAFDLVEPPITSIVQPVEDIGNLAAQVLISKIKGEPIPNNVSRVLSTRLAIRKSCGTI